MAQLLASASTGAMGSLLGKLGTMLSDEYKLLKGARGDIKFLKDELEAMHAFLLMMADVENPDPQAKLRADTVREMSYEIEDNIDKFMILVEHDSSSKSDGFGKLFNKSMQHIADIKTRHKIANDLKDIKCQVKEVSERYARYRIDESTRTRKEKVDPRLRAIYKNASDLVGVDGPRDELVKWLNNHEGESTHKPKVVSIVGYGGLGKTTLAKQVYDKLGPNYECRAFVSISRSPYMKKIFSSILSQVQNQDYTHAVLGDLQFIIDQIRAFLKDKRYFILIDDVWDTQTWEDLDCAFIRNDLGSVILTTTRINDVAKLCCPSHGDLVYKIRPLDIVNSKTLFFKRIFGCEEKCPPNLKEASEDILKKCGGLPLAINAISSLLASHKESREEWERVRRSIGFSQGKASDIDAMTYILSLSYFDLPLYLRSCLLYLTMFPEDHLIEPRRLIRRWISEGFIHAENAQDPVEVGEKYLYELINRSLIQPVDIGRFDEKATWCQVHDTILDFLTYKCTEDNFCTLLTGPSKPVNRVRRLTLMGNEDVQSIEQLDLSHARSLGAFGSSREYLPSLARLNALRVLDINGCRGLGNLHVKDIGRLLQLRHLDISWTGITELPKEIGDLEYLEMLDTSACPRLVELPESVSRLKRLASLLISEKTRLPDKIGNMTKLQRLGCINVFMQSLDFLEDLGELANLRNLSILWDTNNEPDKASYMKQKLVSSLCKLERCKLRDLYVSFNLTEKDVTFIDHSFFPALKSIREISVGSGKLCWITKWMVSLVNLQTLNVFGETLLEQQDVEMVGNIPNLLKLVLNRDITGPIVIGGGFQRLQELEFNPCATTLLCEAGAMPNLKCLNHHIHPLGFKSAHGDAGFNIGMQHLSSLAQVHVRVYCAGVRVADLEAAEGAFKSMADAHPNRLTFGITRFSAHRILQGDQRS